MHFYIILFKEKKKEKKNKEKDKKKNTFHILLLNSADRKTPLRSKYRDLKKERKRKKQ